MVLRLCIRNHLFSVFADEEGIHDCNRPRKKCENVERSQSIAGFIQLPRTTPLAGGPLEGHYRSLKVRRMTSAGPERDSMLKINLLDFLGTGKLGRFDVDPSKSPRCSRLQRRFSRSCSAVRHLTEPRESSQLRCCRADPNVLSERLPPLTPGY